MQTMSNTTWDRLVYGDEIQRVKREKSVTFISKTIYTSSFEDEKADGWELLSEMKNPKKLKVKKEKPQDEVFEEIKAI
jgi:DNA sulfur modification protein DndB